MLHQGVSFKVKISIEYLPCFIRKCHLSPEALIFCGSCCQYSVKVKPKPVSAAKKSVKEVNPPVNKSKAAILLAAKLNGVQKSIAEAVSFDKVSSRPVIFLETGNLESW